MHAFAGGKMKIFKSYGFWTAFAGAVVILVNSLGQLFGFSIEIIM